VKEGTLFDSYGALDEVKEVVCRSEVAKYQLIELHDGR
jgi:hypothetical protein